MDPLTHIVAGTALYRLTGGSVSAFDPASVGMIAGSVFPDLDILLKRWGDYVYLKNHRGVTHSIIGLVVSAFFISVVLCLVYPSCSFGRVFLSTLAGCLSHSFLDLFNAYGARLFWPFSNRKYYFGLLLIFDPVFAGLLLGFIFSTPLTGAVFVSAFIIYLGCRAATRRHIRRNLRRMYGSRCIGVSILPSLRNPAGWHFIVETDECNIIGDWSIINRSFKLERKLPKISEDEFHEAVLSPVGVFFKEFTPLFHVTREEDEEKIRYTFIDMRYYMRNDFLHHAVLELHGDCGIVRQSFNPYNMGRSVEIS